MKRNIKEVIRKFEKKQQRKDLFGPTALETNAWILARALATKDKLSSRITDKKVIESSLRSGQMRDFDLSSIYEQAKSYVNE